MPGRPHRARNTKRPIRPKPLTPIFITAAKTTIQTKSSQIDASSAGITSTLTPVHARSLLKALADPLRLQIIEALGEGERCVCDLTEGLDLAQSKLSFHLRVLREAGLVNQRSSGRWSYYRLEPQAIEQLAGWLMALRQRCDQPATPCR
jgi:ArsR family transcriptional regulator